MYCLKAAPQESLEGNAHDVAKNILAISECLRTTYAELTLVF